MCSPALLLPAYQIVWYRAYSSHLIQRLQNRLPAGKKERQKMKPSCVRNHDPELFATLAGIPAGIRCGDP